MNNAGLTIDENLFQKAVQTASEDLSELTPEKRKDGLRLTGLEVLVFIGGKIVVPILCSFVKDALYQKYKNLKTNNQVAEAKKELLASPGPFTLQVDRDTLIRDVSQSLSAEGVPAELAQRTVQHTLNYVESQLASTRPVQQKAAGE